MRIAPKVAIAPITREPREAQPSAVKTGETASGDASSVVKLSIVGVTASAESGPSAATTTSRLQTIRAMLDRGDYPVDLDLLASRIVDDEVLRVGRS